MHQVRLFPVAVRTAILRPAVLALAIAAAYFYRAASIAERYAIERDLVAELRQALLMTSAKMGLYADDARRILNRAASRPADRGKGVRRLAKAARRRAAVPS